MRQSCHQVLFLLWVFVSTWNSKVNVGAVYASNRPTVESKSTTQKGQDLVQTRPRGFPQLSTAGRNLPSFFAVTRIGRGYTPLKQPDSSSPSQLLLLANTSHQPALQPALEEERTRPIKMTSISPVQLTKRLKVIPSAGRMRRSTGPLEGDVTTPPTSGGLTHMASLENPSTPTKTEVHHKSTQSWLAQMLSEEPKQTTVSPYRTRKWEDISVRDHGHTTTISSTPNIQSTTARQAMTKVSFTAKNISPKVPTITKPFSTRNAEAPLSTVSTEPAPETDIFLLSTATPKATNSITPLPSQTTNGTPRTSPVTLAPSTASISSPTTTSNLATITNLKRLSTLPVTISQEGNKSGPGNSGDPGESGSRVVGSVVAALVGGVLLVMLGGIAFIMMRKRRRQQMQVNDGTWAGPSPFLDGSSGVGDQPRLMVDEEAEVRLRDSKRISLWGFFPRRLTHRLSQVREADEQVLMTEVQTGITFGQAQEIGLDSTNEGTPEQNLDQNENLGSTQIQAKELNNGPEKKEESNQNQVPTQDDATVNTLASSPPAESSTPPPGPLKDSDQELASSEDKTVPPPPQLEENHLPPSIIPSLDMQEVDLGPPVSVTDITPSPTSEVVIVPPPAPPLPTSI